MFGGGIQGQQGADQQKGPVFSMRISERTVAYLRGLRGASELAKKSDEPATLFNFLSPLESAAFEKGRQLGSREKEVQAHAALQDYHNKVVKVVQEFKEREVICALDFSTALRLRFYCGQAQLVQELANTKQLVEAAHACQSTTPAKHALLPAWHFEGTRSLHGKIPWLMLRLQ